eukprot:12881084-Alexandrium_andersonii.AAC.1
MSASLVGSEMCIRDRVPSSSESRFGGQARRLRCSSGRVCGAPMSRARRPARSASTALRREKLASGVNRTAGAAVHLPVLRGAILRGIAAQHARGAESYPR